MASKDTRPPARPTHRRTVSTLSAKAYTKNHTASAYAASSTERAHFSYVDVSSTSSATGTAKTSSRIMTSVRRTIGSLPKKKSPGSPSSPDYGIISTPAERTLPTSARKRDYDPSLSRPTIDQIAMGLHTSRTPHLWPLSSTPSPYSPSRRSASPLVLPPPPARSSLKQPTTSPGTFSGNNPASASSTTVTSNNPPTPKSPMKSMSTLRVRMARFLPRTRNASAPPSRLSSTTSSPRGSMDFPTPKKAVRFSAQVKPADD